MWRTTERIGAAALILFFGVAVLYVERGRVGGRGFGISRSARSRAAERNNAPLTDRKTLKRALYVDDDESTLSESARPSPRNLTPKERRSRASNGSFHAISAAGLNFAPKVTTSVFLAVLNL
jgi:hypothetical protein